MNMTLSGHDDRYAVEQLLLALFPENTPLEAVSSLHRGKTWITLRASITLDGKTAQAVRRLLESGPPRSPPSIFWREARFDPPRSF